MLNEDLLSDKEKETAYLKLTIKGLKKTIADFKKYDAERKKFYKESMIELGQLKSAIQEIEDTSNPKEKTINSLQLKLKRYKDLYEHQKLINKAYLENSNPDIVQLQFYKEGYLKLQEQISNKERHIEKLNKDIEVLRKSITSLICDGRTNKTSEGEQLDA